MNEINKTLYIPLYGKAKVSKMGIILNDKTAETIWDENAVSLGRKSKSKWLAYFMANAGEGNLTTGSGICFPKFRCHL